MELKRLAPWNWFKKEEEIEHAVPVRYGEGGNSLPERHYAPVRQIHRDIDRIFDSFFRGFDLPFPAGLRPFEVFGDSGLLKPRADQSATDSEYQLTVEIPGVNERDVSLDISGNTLTIRGEKRQEKEEKAKDYYRIERSYGSFQRVLSLPEDVDQDTIKATFKNGVLTVTMPRKAASGNAEVKQIEITPAP